jgi:O-acetyl-ADP-ribose deacetylase (regulator of RNase III)
MEIIYKVSDIFTTDAAFIVQGCNAQGQMNTGIAAAIRLQYPKVFNEYQAYYKMWGLKLGELIPVWVDPIAYNGHMVGERVILNGITQEFFGVDPIDPNVLYVSYDAIAQVCKEIATTLSEAVYVEFAQEKGSWTNGMPNVAFPLIGAGRANGLWPEIAKQIEQESPNYQPIVYVESQEKLDGLWKQWPEMKGK